MAFMQLRAMSAKTQKCPSVSNSDGNCPKLRANDRSCTWNVGWVEIAHAVLRRYVFDIWAPIIFSCGAHLHSPHCTP
eukprot:6413520-Alexandrium_andersonii.AAC.1